MSTGQLWLFPPPKPLVGRFGDDFFHQIPTGPGVYYFCGHADGVLYVVRAGSQDKAAQRRVQRQLLHRSVDGRSQYLLVGLSVRLDEILAEFIHLFLRVRHVAQDLALVTSPGLLELLLERLTGSGHFHQLPLLHQPFIALLDEAGLGVEIGDVVAVLDFHRLELR